MKYLTLILLISFISLNAWGKLNVITSTPDLAYLAKEIGKDRVEVFSIGKATQDPHQIEGKPSFMIKMRNADLMVSHGLELESAWLDPLIKGSRNRNITNGTNGYLELGNKLSPIESMKTTVSRADGDVHPDGNPHFQLDPIRMGEAAIILAQRMAQLDKENETFFIVNAQTLKTRLEKLTVEWRKRIELTGIKEIVTYHKTFSYFLDRFQIKSIAQLEPKPGIPPTANHIMQVIKLMKERKIQVIFVENIFNFSIVSKIKESIPELKATRLPVSVGGESNINTTEELIERLVKALESSKN